MDEWMAPLRLVGITHKDGTRDVTKRRAGGGKWPGAEAKSESINAQKKTSIQRKHEEKKYK